MNLENNTKKFLPANEQSRISRSILDWFNECPTKPVRAIGFEYLDADETGMALSTIQGAYRVKEHITGTYEARYQFRLIYRIQPNGDHDRLKADEVLDGIADWAASRLDMPSLGPGMTVESIEPDSKSALLARYKDGSEDHQILMTMNYSVE